MYRTKERSLRGSRGAAESRRRACLAGAVIETLEHRTMLAFTIHHEPYIQLGNAPLVGSSAYTASDQVEIIWRNIVTILQSAGMDVTNIVKLTTYSTAPEHLPVLREVRERVLNGHLPASTLLIVAGLAKPEWLVEVEVYAAKAD